MQRLTKESAQFVGIACEWQRLATSSLYGVDHIGTIMYSHLVNVNANRCTHNRAVCHHARTRTARDVTDHLPAKCPFVHWSVLWRRP